MFFRRLNKRGNEGIEQVVKWLLYIAIIIAAGFAIMKVGGRFA